jgi:hypothetical protein
MSIPNMDLIATLTLLGRLNALLPRRAVPIPVRVTDGKLTVWVLQDAR